MPVQGQQTLQIAAYDGTAWSDWTDFILTTTAPQFTDGNNDPAITIKLPNFLQGRRMVLVLLIKMQMVMLLISVPDEDICKQQ